MAPSVGTVPTTPKGSGEPEAIAFDRIEGGSAGCAPADVAGRYSNLPVDAGFAGAVTGERPV
ncbi:MAG: hypothetical protein ACLP74_08340 [Thermoplasmata archaeon]